MFRAQRVRVKCDTIMAKTVRVLVSFFLATESGQTSRHPLHPLSERDHEGLRNFKQHLIHFTGLTDIAFSKGLGPFFRTCISRY